MKINVLCEEFDKTAIRPRDMFDLGLGTIMAVNSLILTYLIVLLQFKTTTVKFFLPPDIDNGALANNSTGQ